MAPQTIGNPHQNSDMWEGGYRRQEIERQKLLLKERKEELEARRKRIQTLRRAAKKGAPSMDNLAEGASLSDLSCPSGGMGTIGSAASVGTVAERDRDIMDNDMDLNTETEVIRNHLEQLKR